MLVINDVLVPRMITALRSSRGFLWNLLPRTCTEIRSPPVTQSILRVDLTLGLGFYQLPYVEALCHSLGTYCDVSSIEIYTNELSGVTRP